MLYILLCLMDRLIDGRWMIHALFAAIDLKAWILLGSATVTGIFQHMTGGGLILTGNGKRQCEQILGRAKIRKYHVLFMQTIHIYRCILYIYICIYYICIYYICICYICIYCICMYIYILVFSFYIYIYIFID